MDPARHRRLFFALWPTDQFRAEIETATHAIALASGGRLIPARNLHVTLLFLGEVPAENFDVVQQAAAPLAGSPAFELSFDGVEAWGRRLLCLTSSTPPAAAIDLATRLRAHLSNFVREDEREFRPHITLARDLPRSRPTQKIEVLRQQVNDFALVESVRDARGSQYSVLNRWPLERE
ncbi:RNA 2',3'-cyclic phosphodiesterase [Steroidobacter sp. S1-65]|uniref:RNA 2',3'-cyclic phosphodiesterase n=1 Tax=Steroidobacter gossypii TaxID=2805490 RepID=A0ABS1WR13_9GAMM|nr:RNA 2',3'-cyclic phosphodiesterase [Steroidobacter gossypii]MBM0103421.1 RNA 2',3'-cyclic phosphodiesterase [Steroidobacter gossypii]